MIGLRKTLLLVSKLEGTMLNIISRKRHYFKHLIYILFFHSFFGSIKLYKNRGKNLGSTNHYLVILGKLLASPGLSLTYKNKECDVMWGWNKSVPGSTKCFYILSAHMIYILVLFQENDFNITYQFCITGYLK